jgi:hypothetical protein
MLNSDLLKSRLSQYGVAWLLAFALGLLLTLAVPPLAHMRLVQVADIYLPLAFLLLGLALLGALVLGLLSRESFPVKLILVLLTLILALPLFWAPVLGAVLSAYITHASIEYSQAYAGFRILIGELIFPLSQALFAGALWDSVWKAFQVISTLIGGLVGIYQFWGILQQLFGPRRREQEA